MAEEQPQMPESLSSVPVPNVTAGTVINVHNWLARGEVSKVTELAALLQPVDLAGLLELSSEDDRQIMIGLLKAYLDAEVISHLAPEVREELLERLAPREIAAVAADLDSDDAVNLVEELDDEQREAVMANLSREDRAHVEEALTYPAESAGRLMQREVVSVPEGWTVGKTIDHLHDQSQDLPPVFHDIVVVDPYGKVVGQLHLYHLLREGRSVKVRDIMDEDVRPIPVTTDREEVAYNFKHYRLQSAPVVDAEGKLLGIITIDDMVDVMEEEAEEDIRAMAGVGAEESIHDDVVEVTKSRFVWLLVNLFTAILAAWSISLFEGSLEQIVALAVLMPICASMGGNAGTQTLTVAVRALATKDLGLSNYWRFAFREIRIGAVNGLGFAAIMGLIAWGWFGSPGIGLVIGAAMIINLVAAAFAGALIPIAMRAVGFDPAVTSVVFLTTVTDVVGFVAFLGLATLFLL